MNTIILNSSTTIKPDNTSGWKLIVKEDKIRESGKKEGEAYVSEDITYYPTLKQCLNRFLDLGFKECKDVEEILATIKGYEKIANRVSKIYAKEGELVQL